MKFFFSVLLLFSLTDIHAEDDFEIDMDGFDEEFMDESTEIPLAVEEKAISKFSFSGNIAFKTAYGYREHSVDGVEYSGINQAQTALFLQADYKFSDTWRVRVSGDTFYDIYYDISNQNFNNDTLNAYSSQLRFDDTYIQGQLTKDIDIKVGRQIVVWGKSDTIRITDVINPLDNRLPGMTDIEDLRLSTSMAKVDYYFGEWSLSLMSIFESRIFLEAAPFGEFFPADKVYPNAPNPFITLVQPASSFDNIQYALSLNGIFSGWDISFYGADVYDSRWHLEGVLPNNASRVVSKIQMLGTAFNIAHGSWLFKSEVAFIDSLKYNSTQNEKSRLDALLGFDYMGISDTVLSLEVSNRHIFKHEKQMSGVTAGYVPDYVQKDEVQTAIRATHSMKNDTLNATLLLSMFGHNWQYGGFFRASLEYDIMDALVMNFGLIDYLDTSIQEEKPFIRAISDNDKIFLDITYSF